MEERKDIAVFFDENQRVERSKKREEVLRIREKRAKMDFSIVIFPTGSHGVKLINKVGLLHKIYRTLQRSVITRSVTLAELTSYEQRVNKLSGSLPSLKRDCDNFTIFLTPAYTNTCGSLPSLKRDCDS